MTNMKAAIYTGIQAIEIHEVAYEAAEPYHVIIDTKCTGICGSDLHNYFGNWEPSATVAAGHETCGIVAEVGQGVTTVQPGDRVVVECFSHCGRCDYCRNGHYNHCIERKWISHEKQGGFAEYTTVHESGLFKLPKSLDFEQGALVEPLAVCRRAVAQAGISYEDRVAVIGGGTIGLLSLAMAKAAGAQETLITVKYEQQAQLAEALGADHVIDVSQTDVAEYVRELTGAFGVDAVIETVGGAGNFDTAVSMVRRRGTVVLVAGYHKPLEVDLRKIVWPEINVTGSNCYAYSGLKSDFQAAIELIDSGKIEATRLVTHRFPLDEVSQAFQIAADKNSGAIKVHLYQD